MNGSPTKTQMVDSAGGKSQVATLTTAGIILIVLLFLTKPLQYMPEAVLAVGRVPHRHRAGRHRRDAQDPAGGACDEFVVASITAGVVVVVGVEQGILLAIVFSVIDHLRRSYHPSDSVLVRTDHGRVPVDPGDGRADARDVEPGLVVYRFAAEPLLRQREPVLRGGARRSWNVRRERRRWLCIDAAAIGDVDYSAGETIISLHAQMQEHGTRLVFADVDDDVKAELDRFGISALVGPDAYFDSVVETTEAFTASTSERSGDG